MRLKSPRVKDDGYLASLRELPCVICRNDTTVEAAHIRTGNLDYGKRETGFGEKPSDWWCLPLCRNCHTEQHRGNEVNFWTNYGINPWVLALSLYAAKFDHEMCLTILERQGYSR